MYNTMYRGVYWSWRYLLPVIENTSTVVQKNTPFGVVYFISIQLTIVVLITVDNGQIFFTCSRHLFLTFIIVNIVKGFSRSLITMFLKPDAPVLVV